MSENERRFNDSIQAFYIMTEAARQLPESLNVFHCQGHASISSLYTCDGNRDCPGDASDEVGCHCNKTMKYSSKCKYLREDSGEIGCSSFYIPSGQMECSSYSFSLQQQQNKKHSKPPDTEKTCSTSAFLTQEVFSNHKAKELAEKSFSNCSHNGHLSCKWGKPQCYSVSHICRYQLNKCGYLCPCKGGEHVQNCRKFECNMMFKCPGYYCIQWAYVCDGKWDCPHGLDESQHHHCGNNRSCTNLYICRVYQRCIRLGDVCDGYKDCPLGDDEYFCSLESIECPDQYECLIFSVRCISRDMSRQEKFPFHAIWIQDSFFGSDVSVFLFKYAIQLTVTNTNMVKICEMARVMNNIILLDISSNSINTIESRCFEASFKLRTIKLNSNSITVVQEYAFINLALLLLLDLSNNSLSQLSGNLFDSLIDIIVLSIHSSNLTAENFPFDKIQLAILETDHISMCCMLKPGTTCTAVFPWYFSCSDILPGLAFQITFCLVSLVILVFNILSIRVQRLSFTQGLEKIGAYGTTVASTNISDIFCAVPLFLLWAAGLYYKGDFMLKEEQWRSSPLCFIIFATFLMFCLLSPMLLFFRSFLRLMVVLHPLDTQFKQTQFVVNCVVCLFVASSALAVVITVLSIFLTVKLPMDLCSPFIDPTDSVIMTQVVTWVVVILQLSAVAFIITDYIILVKSLQKSQKSVQE